MSKIVMKKNVLDLLQNLTDINMSIVLEKNDNGVLVKRSNASSTIAYILSASDVDVSFEEEKVAFYRFDEFFRIFSSFENPNIEIEANKIVLSSGSSKINYILSDPETIKAGPKNINFSKTDVKMKITPEIQKEIKKMITLVSAQKVLLETTEDKKLKVKLFNASHDNSFEKIYDVEEFNSEVKMTISSDIFQFIPDHEYSFEINGEGIVKLHYIDPTINLDIYTAELGE